MLSRVHCAYASTLHVNSIRCYHRDQSGRLDEGRVMLARILATDRNNVTALLWMTEVAATPEEVRIYLQRVLAIDPNNARREKGLSYWTKPTNRRSVNPARLGHHVFAIHSHHGTRAAFQRGIGRHVAQPLDQASYHTRPAGLVTRAQPAPLSPWKYS